MCVSALQCPDGRLDDMRRRVEVWLADFQVDDVAALGLKAAGLRQHLKRGLGAKSAHAVRELEGHRPASSAARRSMRVPAVPTRASPIRCGVVIKTISPPPSRKRIPASILGPMLPGGNWPSARYRRASATVIVSIGR